jgi:hypothetical protein
MVRKFGSIREVCHIADIPWQRDAVLVFVDGWGCVQPRGAFETGERVIYVQIDSFVPVSAVFGEQFPAMSPAELDGMSLAELNGRSGYRVSELLGIEKYVPPTPAHLEGHAIGTLTKFMPRTGLQERVQDHPRYLVDFADERFEVSEKLDGFSMTVYYYRGAPGFSLPEFGVCEQRRIWDRDDDNAYTRTASSLMLQKLLGDYGRSVALQGELIGNGIGGKIEEIDGVDFLVFDAFDLEERRYLTAGERDGLVGELNKIASGYGGRELNQVPFLGCHRLRDCVCAGRSGIDRRLPRQIQLVQGILRFARGESWVNLGAPREGLMFKQVGGDLTFKVINNEFLLYKRRLSLEEAGGARGGNS